MKNRGKEQYLARRLSFRELDFIDTVEASIEHSFPNKFEFVNQLNYIGIKVKGSPFSPYLFKKPDNKLIFHYFKAETKSFENIVIKSFDSGELDFIINTIKEHSPDKFLNEDNTRFLEQANDKERTFLNSFKKTMEIMYPKTFSFANATNYYGVRYLKQSKAVFLFKRKNNKLLFISKSEYTLNQIVEINNYTEQDLDKVLKLVSKTLQSQRNEQLVTAETLDDSTSSFPESLETEQRRFVMTFKKVIEEHYPQSFDVFIDKKYLSFKDKKSNMPIFWFLKKSGKLLFQCHPKKEDTTMTHIKSVDKDTLLETIRLAKYAADTYGVYAIDDKRTPEERKKKIKPQLEKEKEPAKSEVVTKNGSLKIYSYIKDEILGLEYKALPSIKALCRNVKAYLLSAINESSGKNYENALIACDNELFFGNRLVWSEAAWLRSTKIIYRYFKANTLVEKIKDYEEINEVELVNDYPTLLNHLYANLSGFSEIDYRNNLYFKEPLPDRLVRSLNEIEENFRGYEIN